MRQYTTTYIHSWHPEWTARTRFVDSRAAPVRSFIDLVREDAPAVVHGAGGARTGYVDLIAAAVLARRGHNVLVADATWEPGSRALARRLRKERSIAFDPPAAAGANLSRRLIAALDSPRTHYAVLSSHELQSFPRVWGVDSQRVHFTPFCATTSQMDRGPAGSHVLASGNSLRDYRALIEAAPRVKREIILASSLPMPDVLPANVTANFMTEQDHDDVARQAAVVVVPLLADTDRSAGQQTYLNAMARGQPVVVTDAPGVRDHVEHGKTGLVVANEPVALAEAVNQILEEPDLARRLGESAQARVQERFTLRRYVDRLLALADSL